MNSSVICHRLRSCDQFTMLFLRIPDTLSGLDLLAAVYLVSTYFTYSTYVRIGRNFLDSSLYPFVPRKLSSQRAHVRTITCDALKTIEPDRILLINTNTSVTSMMLHNLTSLQLDRHQKYIDNDVHIIKMCIG